MLLLNKEKKKNKTKASHDLPRIANTEWTEWLCKWDNHQTTTTIRTTKHSHSNENIDCLPAWLTGVSLSLSLSIFFFCLLLLLFVLRFCLRLVYVKCVELFFFHRVCIKIILIKMFLYFIYSCFWLLMLLKQMHTLTHSHTQTHVKSIKLQQSEWWGAEEAKLQQPYPSQIDLLIHRREKNIIFKGLPYFVMFHQKVIGI